MFKKKLRVILMLTVVFVFAGITGVYAGAEIYVNGVGTDTAPIIKEEQLYLPVRSIAEQMEFKIGFDEETKVITLKKDALSIELTAGNSSFYINGAENSMSLKPINEDGVTYAPKDFIEASFNGTVDYTAANTVDFYTTIPVQLQWENANIVTKSLEKTWPSGDEKNEEWYVSYSVKVPIISDTQNKDLENSLNTGFEKMLTDIAANVEESFEEQKGNDFPVRVSGELGYRFIANSQNYFSVLLEGYDYYGGAHGMPYRKSVNVMKGKEILLGDLFFEGSGYEKALIDKMNSIRLLSSTQEYHLVQEVTELPVDSFYIKDGNLVIYYQPYELASYARGFVEFRISLNELVKFLDPKL